MLSQDNYILAPKKLGSATGAAKSHADTDLMKDAQRGCERFPHLCRSKQGMVKRRLGRFGHRWIFHPGFWSTPRQSQQKGMDSENEDMGMSTAHVEAKRQDHRTHQAGTQDGFPPSPCLEGAGT